MKETWNLVQRLVRVAASACTGHSVDGGILNVNG